MSCLKNLASIQSHLTFHQDLIRMVLYLFCALSNARHNLSSPMVDWQIEQISKEPAHLPVIAMSALLNYIYEKKVNTVTLIISSVLHVFASSTSKLFFINFLWPILCFSAWRLQIPVLKEKQAQKKSFVPYCYVLGRKKIRSFKYLPWARLYKLWVSCQ